MAQGKGLGAAALNSQVESASALGFREIRAYGAGSGEPGNNTNGYYTWPRLGFQGGLGGSRDTLEANTSLDLTNVSSLRELFRIPGGPEAWKQYGKALHLYFDLTPGSTSREVLKRYGEAKAAAQG